MYKRDGGNPKRILFSQLSWVIFFSTNGVLYASCDDGDDGERIGLSRIGKDTAPALYHCCGTYIRGHGNWTTCVVFPEPCLLFGSSLQDFYPLPKIPRTEISAPAVVVECTHTRIYTYYKAGAPKTLH